MVGCFKEMIFTYIDSSDISLSNGANRSSLSRFIQKLLKKHQGLLYFETDIRSKKSKTSQCTSSKRLRSASTETSDTETAANKKNRSLSSNSTNSSQEKRVPGDNEN